MPSIELNDVSVDFPIYTAQTRSIRADLLRRMGGRIQEKQDDKRFVVNALRNINLSLRSGDRLGLVGPNGAGKSTLLRVLSGVYEPPRGTIRIEGQISSLLDVALGIDPELNGYDNIILRGVLLGMTSEELREKTPGIAEFSELGDFLNLPVRTYSSGMMLRLAFAICTAIRPDIVLLDEVVGVGDADFAEKAKARTRQFANDASIVVLASHDTTVLRDFCDQAALLRDGRIVEIGPVAEVLDHYRRTASP
jgi:ABC-type polysaccharide/polyol phosphate transport system ATPase subunit